MAILAIMVWKQSTVSQAAVIVAALVMLGGSGCAQGIYRPPIDPIWEPPQATNVETIDLSRLAHYRVPNDLIDRGDVLEVTIVTDYDDLSTTTTPVRITENGTANIPLIGEVALAGLRLDGAEQVIISAARQREVFKHPYVTVTMKQQRINRVTVIGAVENPGVYELPRSASFLLAALVAAGNPSENAGPQVEIRRPLQSNGLPGGFDSHPPRVAGVDQAGLVSYEDASAETPRTIRVNLASAAREGRGGYYLDDGDVVMVSKQNPKPIHVLGLVREPGQYELPVQEDLHLLDALAMAGGRRSQLADKVWIIRRVPGEPEPITIEVSVREAKRKGAHNVRLAAGDMVSVEMTPTTVVVDTLRNIARVGLNLGGQIALF